MSSKIGQCLARLQARILWWHLFRLVVPSGPSVFVQLTLTCVYCTIAYYIIFYQQSVTHFSLTDCDQQRHFCYYTCGLLVTEIPFSICAPPFYCLCMYVCMNAWIVYVYSRPWLPTIQDTIRDAILTYARKPTWVSFIYCMEMTTKKCKTEKLRGKIGYAQK